MSVRDNDAGLADRLREYEGRLRAVEQGRTFAAEVSTESLLLRTRDGRYKYRIQPGTNPGTIELFDAVSGTTRRVIAVP